MVDGGPPEATPQAPADEGAAPASIGVVGAGLIGGSIARAYLGLGVPVHVADPDAEVLRLAAKDGARPITMDRLADEVEVVFLCPPPRAVAPAWQELVAATEGARRRRLLVLDVASVKRPVLEGIGDGDWASAGAVLSLSHPMAGREAAGWPASDPELFQRAPWVLMPPPGTTGEEVLRAVAAVRALGATPCFMDPTFHDHFAGLTSHVAHALAFAFQAQVDALDPHGWRRFSGNSLRDLLRVASSDHDLWTEILTANQAELAPLLRDLADRLERFDPATDIPTTPPVDPVPDPSGPDGGPLELSCGRDEPIDAIREALLATGPRGLHLDSAAIDDAGRLRLRFGAPLASST